MQCVANYEIKSDVSVGRDDTWLKLAHPKGLYKARIRNITRTDFSTPFLLTLHLTFETPSLQEAKEIADERLADCLNMLAFIANSTFRRHRIRQIVECTPGEDMRNILFWGDAIENEDPQPILNPKLMSSVERMMAFDQPPSIRRALRWYRLGIQAVSPDDQFQYFWFALEILAVYQEAQAEVPDKCPHCESDLFCKTCNKTPHHMPYPRQKIRDLIFAVDKEVTGATVKMLDSTRNAVMHGKTLKEIKEKFPQAHEEVVDVLGRILFKALIHQFPPVLLKEKLSFANPNTYVHRIMTGVATMQMPVHQDADGEFDLSFGGTKVELLPDGPPQSALPTRMLLSQEDYKLLGKLAHEKSDQQEMCRRIWQRGKPHEQVVLCVVLSTEAKTIEQAIRRGDKGNWQDFFRRIIESSRKPPEAKP